MKKKMFVLAVATTVLGSSLLAASSVFAQGVLGGPTHRSSLAEKIAVKFGLNKDAVQAVIEQERQEMVAKHEAEYEARLSQLVTDGKITQQQKQLILAKNAEIRAKHEARFESFKDMDLSEHKAIMESERQELESWAKANGIDMKYLMFRFHMKGSGPGTGGEQVMMHFGAGPILTE